MEPDGFCHVIVFIKYPVVLVQWWEVFLEYREEYPRNGTGNIGGVGGCKPRHVAVSGPGFLSPIGGGM